MTCSPKRLALFWLLFALAVAPALGQGESKKPQTKEAATRFLRIQRDAVEEPVALETSVVRYVPIKGEPGLTVDLVGVVHVADRSYYEKLNKLFDQYDVVLYELVAPQGTRPPKGGKREGGNPLAMIQDMMKIALQLESQMEHIDYSKKHFVHADLSFEELGKVMRDRGESGMTIALSVFADLMRQQNVMKENLAKKPAGKTQPQPESLNDLLGLMLDPAGPVKLKRMMAEQFEALENPAGGLGQTLNTLLISDRNAAAMKVLHKEMARGKKRIAIFYGAAHMPDFEKRLQAEFGLKKENEKWLAAWDLRPRQPSGLEEVLKKLVK